ncbi:MAG: hypothetical protein IJ228_08645, partial [Succinivibrio sp.]|nr:hypothetical protein [Succinivibrio sp.]
AQAMQQDISKALELMADFIDPKHWVMNYPYGNYSPEVLDFIQAHGACLGLTTEPRAASLGTDHPLLLPRLDCNDFPPKSGRYLELGNEAG